MHAVVFDLDGTILQSAAVDDRLYRDAVRCVLGDVRIRPTLVDYDYVTDSGILAQILADNSVAPNPETIRAIKSNFVDALASHISLNGPFPEVPGAHDFLARLHSSTDHAIAIATGGWRESAQLKLDAAGLNRYGIPLATSDDAPDRKDIMRIALEHLGTGFESITYYGDGPWDRIASQQLGWDFVAVGPALGGLDSYAVSGPSERLRRKE